MRSLLFCVGLVLLWSFSVCADEGDRPPNTTNHPPLEIAKLDPKLDGKEVTIKLTVDKWQKFRIVSPDRE